MTGIPMNKATWLSTRTHSLRWLIPSLGVVLLCSCTSEDIGVSTSQCQAAVARASTTWEVKYYTHRTNPGTQRTERFASTQLINRNGEPPTAAATGPDEQGIWWPAPPSRPTNDDVDRQRRAAEQNDPPTLQRRVDYILQCDEGDLTANENIYQQAAQAIRSGKAVQVRHRLGKIVDANLTASNEAASEGTSEGTSQTEVARSPSERPPASPRSVVPAPGILYVDPVRGSDGGRGTEAEPFKTIAYAIAQAGPNTTIQLSPGTYSAETGETFPLRLKSGITLQGNKSSQGRDILITGGGDFVSPSWAKQNVAIRATDSTKLSGLTLSNPNVRGSAVWVETGTPIIANNTFRNNHREGVFVAGSATPELRDNLFEQNSGNGISFTRNSGGLLIGNTIRSSGYGVAIGDRSNPLMNDNQITDNRSGVVISGEARPVLRQNTITNNQQDGIVATNNAQPLLQQNTLSRNGQYDIHNNTNRPLSLESGNLAGLKVEGDVQ